jgi:hypothetical protein
MLHIVVPAGESYDETNNLFITTKEQKLCLEHSLVSVSKWESKFHKPFLSNNDLSSEEFLYYVKCMTITQNIRDEVYFALSADNVEAIKRYIKDPMTATTINETGGKGRRGQTITSELIYYWMIASNIPIKCETWHLNRLLMLIRVCQAENAPKKKMSRGEISRRNYELNQRRRKQMHTSG